MEGIQHKKGLLNKAFYQTVQNHTHIMTNIKTKNFGIPGAGAFDVLTIENIGMAGGDYVDRIVINGQTQGGQGGTASQPISLTQGEYVNEISIIARADSYVSYLKFATNKGQSIEAGTISIEPTVVSNIKLLGITGYSGWYINQIQFIYDDLGAA